LVIGYYEFEISLVLANFVILVEVEIMVEHRFLVGNCVSVLDLVVKILVLVGSTSFLVLSPMVKILVAIGFSPFSVQILIVVES
jgi:hypothetical protein